jgi:hypothetical protein
VDDGAVRMVLMVVGGRRRRGGGGGGGGEGGEGIDMSVGMNMSMVTIVETRA